MCERKKRTNGSAAHLYFIWTTVLTFVAAGCGDDPTFTNSIGSQLVTTGVTIRDTTIEAIGSSTFKQPLAMNGSVNLVGRYEGYLAYTAIQFALPRRDTILILSAELRLRAVSWFGDSSARFRFDAHKISRGWSPATLQWDSVGAGFFESAIAGTFDGSVAADTQQIALSLTDTALVRQWFLESAVPSYGIILVPDLQSTNVVRGMYAFGGDSVSYYPTLVIDALSLNGKRDTMQYNTGIDTFVGNVDNLTSDMQLIYLQSGVVYRSTVRFDLSFIPPGAIVNTAQMLLERQPVATRLTKVTVDTVVAAHALISPTDSTRFDVPILGRRLGGTANTFQFEARRAAQLWVNGMNYGILLRATPQSEFNSFDRYTFYNQNAPDSLRPRLKIVYTVEKN